MALIDDLWAMPVEDRMRAFMALTYEERTALHRQIEQRRMVGKWARYEDDPLGFIVDGLHEVVWSKQREIIASVRANKRTAVPACHAPGKSHLAARIVAWWVSSHPPGTARVVTTASTFRQVRGVLWPHIHRVHARHGLPGTLNQVEWKMGHDLAADGFAPADHDETAVQGVHAPHLLVVVDEAGGLGAILGRALEALMTGGHTRLLVLGNPPVDAEGTWFEGVCNSPLYNVIPISAYDTPNFTGEDAGMCASCPPMVAPHTVASHLVDQTWVDDVINEFGVDSAFVEARVFARFPRGAINKTIPISWIEAAADNDSPDEGNAIRLGVDIAADGGDEFVIAKADGWRASIAHHSAGKANEDPTAVAGVILTHILDAEQAHRDRGIEAKVRVKIDAIGVGWGVAGILEMWRREGKHSSTIVQVNVAESAKDGDKFANQRAEMWWNMRRLLQPQPVPGGLVRQALALDGLGTREMAQLNAPTYKSDSSGRIVIERKVDMKRRGLHSPDRAEAILLAVFEPPGAERLAAVATPIAAVQVNQWKAAG